MAIRFTMGVTMLIVAPSHMVIGMNMALMAFVKENQHTGMITPFITGMITLPPLGFRLDHGHDQALGGDLSIDHGRD